MSRDPEHLRLLLEIFSTPANSSNSPLLRLPAELRNHIYSKALDSATMRPDVTTNIRDMQLLCVGAGHLLACRQLYHEALHHDIFA